MLARICAVAVIAAFGLTACGSNGADDPVDPQADPVAYFEAIATATSEAGSYRFDVTMEAGGTTSEGTGVVLVDGEETTARVDLQMPAVAVSPDESTGGTEEVTAITTSDALYYRFPPDDDSPEGQWVSMDHGDNPLSGYLGNASSGVVDVSQFAELGDDLELSVAEADEIDGVPTQDVSVTLTSEQLASTAPEGMPAEIFDQLGEVSYVFTVGDDLLVRKIVVTTEELFDMTTTIHDYGVEETIEVPAEEDTISFDEYMDDMVGDLELDVPTSPPPG